MNLFEELTKKSNDAEATKNDIKNEILLAYSEYVNSEKFINYIKTRVRQENINNRNFCLYAYFWNYQSGCSDTNFTCAGWVWYNPDESRRYTFDSHYYKGIYLKDLQDDVLDGMVKLTRQALNENGFAQVLVDTKLNNLGCREKTITVRW